MMKNHTRTLGNLWVTDFVDIQCNDVRVENGNLDLAKTRMDECWSKWFRLSGGIVKAAGSGLKQTVVARDLKMA